MSITINEPENLPKNWKNPMEVWKLKDSASKNGQNNKLEVCAVKTPTKTKKIRLNPIHRQPIFNTLRMDTITSGVGHLASLLADLTP